MRTNIIAYMAAATLTLSSSICALGQAKPKPADPTRQGSAQPLPQAPIQWLPKTFVQPDGTILLTDPVYQYSVPLAAQTLPVPTTRIHLDVNERIQGALKKLFDQAGQRFELDSDVPANTRVTLRVRNVTFVTALRALLEQADLGWTVNMTVDGKETRAVYRIGKQPIEVQWLPIVDPTLAPQNIPWNLLKSNLQRLPNAKETHSILIDRSGSKLLVTPPYDLQSTKPGASLYHLLQVDPAGGTGSTIQAAPPTLVQPHTPDKEPRSKPDRTEVKIPVLGDLPIVGTLFTTRTRTERSIFTCPHCHEQITVVHSHEAPNCPECGRQFQAEWKVCPFDGAKRPVIAGEWKFCPVCGKSLVDQAAPRPGKK